MQFKKVVQPFLPHELESKFFEKKNLNGIVIMKFLQDGKENIFYKMLIFLAILKIFVIQSNHCYYYCTIFQFLDHFFEG